MLLFAERFSAISSVGLLQIPVISGMRDQTLPDATHTCDKMAYRPHLRIQSLCTVCNHCKIFNFLIVTPSEFKPQALKMCFNYYSICSNAIVLSYA